MRNPINNPGLLNALPFMVGGAYFLFSGLTDFINPHPYRKSSDIFISATCFLCAIGQIFPQAFEKTAPLAAASLTVSSCMRLAYIADLSTGYLSTLTPR